MGEHAENLLTYAVSDEGQNYLQTSGKVSQSIEARSLLSHTTRINFAPDDTTALTQLLSQNFVNLVSDAKRLTTTFRFEDDTTALDPKGAADINRLLAHLSKPENSDKEVIVIGFGENTGTFDEIAQRANDDADAKRKSKMPRTMMTNMQPGIKSVLLACTDIALAPAAMAQDISVGHLTYHTGEYGGFGAFFDGVADFSLEVINENPPLGRKLVAIHEDIGTVGEDNAAKKLISEDNVDVLLNAAHGYMAYRDFMLDTVKANNGPLMPSVHGGGIESQFGGEAEEPIFRGSPMDTGQGIAALLHARNSGKKSVVLVATHAAGSQLQIELAAQVAENDDLEVRGTIDMFPNLNDYSLVLDLVGYLDAEAVVLFPAPSDGGAIVSSAAKKGESWFIVGSSEWQEEGFYDTATQAGLDAHEEVTLAAFSYDDSPAWDFYSQKVSNSPYAEVIGDPANSYALQYYDLLVATALAIEHSGSVDADAWTDSMFAVTGNDGEIVHTYDEGIAALRAGKRINYEGVTGTMEYSDTGVVSGIFGIFEWAPNKTLRQVEDVDGEDVMKFSRSAADHSRRTVEGWPEVQTPGIHPSTP